MARDRSQFLAGGNPIDTDGLIATAHGQALAVGSEGQGEDRAAPAEPLHLFGRGRFPERERAVAGAGGNELAVGSHGDGVDLIPVPEANGAQACRGAGRQ